MGPRKPSKASTINLFLAQDSAREGYYTEYALKGIRTNPSWRIYGWLCEVVLHHICRMAQATYKVFSRAHYLLPTTYQRRSSVIRPMISLMLYFDYAAIDIFSIFFTSSSCNSL
jgi:hypothetical protein